MAVHSISTPAPAPQRGLLRAFAHPLPVLKSEDNPIPAGVVSPNDTLFLKFQEKPDALATLQPAPLPSLTSAFSRRRAIFGAVALAAAPVAIAPAAAVAGDFPSTGMSTEATELQVELETTAKRHRLALKRCDEADEAMVWPVVPEALFRQPRDGVHFAFTRPGRHSDTHRLWWGYPGDVADLRGMQLAYLDGSPIVDARARRDEIVAAHFEYRASVAAAELAAGLPAAEAEYEEAADAFYDVTDRLIAMRTSDPAIMGLKAQAFVELARSQGGHEKVIQSLIAEDSNQAICLGASLLRDFIGQLGATHRMST